MRNYDDDIEKYLKEQLSPAERHALEMEALHDPFLAEALEGAELINATDFESDLKAIKRNLQGSPGSKYLWPLGIAASIALLVVLSYFLFLQNPLINEPIALSTEEKPAQFPIAEVPDQEKDLTQSSGEEEQVKGHEEQKPRAREQSQTQKIEVENIDALDNAGTAATVKPSIADESTALIAEVPPGEDDFEESNERPVAGEAIRSEITTEKASKGAAKKSVTPSPAILSADQTVAEEREFSRSRDMPSQLSKDEYDEYLKANVQYPTSARANRIEGEVTVSFVVKSDSTFGDFKVIKGIGFGCDEELIRLIKEGPAWIPGSRLNETNQVTFEFRLEN